MEQRLPKPSDFLHGVYSWLCEPRNRSVEDLHYLSVETMSKSNYRKYINDFLRQRLSQMVDLTKFDANKVNRLLANATRSYIRNLFS